MTARNSGNSPLTELRVPSRCVTCGGSLGARAFVSNGRLGTYVECEWCFTGTVRPEEPELITDTFTRFGRRCSGDDELDAILDKLTGERA